MRSILFALAAVACVEGTAAAEKIRVDQIPAVTDRQITITTVDGIRHRGIGLVPGAVQLELPGGTWEALPTADIGRIEVKRRGRYFHVSEAGVAVALGGPSFACDGEQGASAVLCLVLTTVVLAPPGLAFAAVTAPVTLTMDGVRLLIPPKVYEIIH